MEPDPSSQPSEQKPLDPLVKTALAVCVGLILICIVGMILTAPDRSIPPYSVVAQLAEVVTVNVPPRTTDAEIEALLVRFQAAGRGDGSELGRLKIKPTTTQDPSRRYQRVTIYVFDNMGLAEETVLHDYLTGRDPTAKGSFEGNMRGMYRLTDDLEFGAMGFVPDESTVRPGRSHDSPRVLFQNRR
jgi:hypothetical protein